MVTNTFPCACQPLVGRLWRHICSALSPFVREPPTVGAIRGPLGTVWRQVFLFFLLSCRHFSCLPSAHPLSDTRWAHDGPCLLSACAVLLRFAHRVVLFDTQMFLILTKSSLSIFLLLLVLLEPKLRILCKIQGHEIHTMVFVCLFVFVLNFCKSLVEPNG